MEAIIARLRSRRADLLAEVGRVDGAITALTVGKAPAKTGKAKTAKKATKAGGRKRRKMTLAERRAVSERMKKSWAARKKKAARG